MQEKNITPLGKAIKAYFKAKGYDKKILEAKIKKIFPGLLPRKVKKHILEIVYSQEMIYVKVDSAIIRQELDFKKDELKKILNLKLEQDAVKDIIIY